MLRYCAGISGWAPNETAVDYARCHYALFGAGQALKVDGKKQRLWAMYWLRDTHEGLR